MDPPISECFKIHAKAAQLLNPTKPNGGVDKFFISVRIGVIHKYSKESADTITDVRPSRRFRFSKHTFTYDDVSRLLLSHMKIPTCWLQKRNCLLKLRVHEDDGGGVAAILDKRDDNYPTQLLFAYVNRRLKIDENKALEGLTIHVQFMKHITIKINEYRALKEKRERAIQTSVNDMVKAHSIFNYPDLTRDEWVRKIDDTLAELNICLETQPLQELASAIIYTIHSRLSSSSSECLICLEEIEFRVPFKVLSCNHMFHIKCLQNWLQNSYSCPTCRRQLDVDSQLPKIKDQFYFL